MTQKIPLEQYIKELPAEEAVKQSLLDQLARGEQEAVKKQVVEMLTQAGADLGAAEALDELDRDFQGELQGIEQQAKNLVSGVNTEADKQALEAARNTIASQ